MWRAYHLATIAQLQQSRSDCCRATGTVRPLQGTDGVLEGTDGVPTGCSQGTEGTHGPPAGPRRSARSAAQRNRPIRTIQRRRARWRLGTASTTRVLMEYPSRRTLGGIAVVLGGPLRARPGWARLGWLVVWLFVCLFCVFVCSVCVFCLLHASVRVRLCSIELG